VTFSALKNQTAREWASKLARGSGEGLVPLNVARLLWDEGAIRAEPTPSRQNPDHVFVKLKLGDKP
jgi:hypothetical protein